MVLDCVRLTHSLSHPFYAHLKATPQETPTTPNTVPQTNPTTIHPSSVPTPYNTTPLTFKLHVQMATWCGPCKVIAPKIVEMSKTFPDARFYKLDVDDVPDVAQELGVRAMPTFMIFKDGEKLGEIVGANDKALAAFVQKQLE